MFEWKPPKIKKKRKPSKEWYDLRDWLKSKPRQK